MGSKAKITELENENADLKAIIDNRNLELEAQNRELKDQLGDVITKLNQILEENLSLRKTNENLAKRVETLETLLSENAISECESAETDETPVSEPAYTPPEKEKYDTLILSDSIMRHVMKDCPKVTKYSAWRDKWYEPHPIEQDFTIPTKKLQPPIKGKKVIMPGARCDKLFSEAIRLSQQYTFEAVIISVGVNYRWEWSKEGEGETINNIQEFLEALKIIFGCRIAYAPMLPVSSKNEQDNKSLPVAESTAKLNESIREINSQLVEFCERRNIKQLTCPSFTMDDENPVPNRHLLAKDGVHLNRKGIVEIDHLIMDYLNTLFWDH